MTCASFFAKSSGQSMAGVEPVRSSNESLAIRVRPDRLFCTFFTVTPTIIPPSRTSAFSGRVARSLTWCEANDCRAAA